MPTNKLPPDVKKENNLSELKNDLTHKFDDVAKSCELEISDHLKATIIDEVLFQTRSPNRAGRIIERFLRSQAKLPSLEEAEFRQERIAYAAELESEPEPDFRLKVGEQSSKILSRKAGGSRGFDRP